MKRLAIPLVIMSAILAVACFLGWRAFHGDQSDTIATAPDVGSTHRSSNELSPALIPGQLDGESEDGAASGVASVSHSPWPQQHIASLITSGNEDRWFQVVENLQKLSPADQWLALSQAEVADQPLAKRIRAKMAISCTSSLRQLDVHAQDHEFSDPPSVVAWCKKLLGAGATSQFMEYAGSFSTASTTSINNAPWWVPSIPARDLTASEQDVQDQQLQDRLRKSQNPLEVRMLVQAMWHGRTDAFAAHWGNIDRLSNFERGVLGYTLPILAACRTVGGCGSNSVALVQYCSLMPGIECPLGASLDEVLRWNFSPKLYRLTQQLVTQILAVLKGSGS